MRLNTANTRRVADIIILAVGFLYVAGVLYHIFAGYAGSALVRPPWFIVSAALFDPLQPKALVLSLLGAAGGVIVVVSAVIRTQFLNGLYGNAHWASELDIRQMGLRAKRGLLLGRKLGRFLVSEGNAHVAVFAPTESGKGVSVVIPNLLNWNGSVICLDIKRENYDATSGFRARHGQQVFLWDPANPEGHTCAYNPLSAIPGDAVRRINETQKIASILFPPQQDKGEIWNPGARSLFIALVLYLLDSQHDATIGGVRRLITGTQDFAGWLADEIKQRHDALDRACIENSNEFLQRAPKERSGIVSQLTTALSIWENPVVDAATARSDFDLSQLRKQRMSIYVAVSPDNLERLAPLLNLFFQQAVDLLIRKKPDLHEEPHPLLLLMDEFTALGYMAVFDRANAYIRGYNIRLFIVIQDLAQLYDIYGRDKANVMLQNLKIKIAFTQNNPDTAKMLSIMLGTKTVRTQSRSQRSGFQPGGMSVSTAVTKRDLMMPHEIMQLSPKKAVLMVEGRPPVLANKITYYKEKVFTTRLCAPAAFTPLDLAAFVAALPRPAPPVRAQAPKRDKAQTGKTSAKPGSPPDTRLTEEELYLLQSMDSGA